MPALQVKDCPADVYERLRACADEENRSISQQTLTIIEDFLESRATHPAAARSRGASLRPPYATADDTDYLPKRERALSRIRELEPLPVSEASPSAVAILTEIRKTEAR